jgi:hypothetical protein
LRGRLTFCNGSWDDSCAYPRAIERPVEPMVEANVRGGFDLVKRFNLRMYVIEYKGDTGYYLHKASGRLTSFGIIPIAGICSTPKALDLLSMS